jgi:NADPH-dependent ferric siderophore reductase
MSQPLQTWARIRLPDAAHVIEKLCDHMLEHNAVREIDGEDDVLRFAASSARFSQSGSQTVIRIISPDLEGLYFMRMAVASHVLEFAGSGGLVLDWQGDGAEISRPPNFSRLEVVGIADVTPKMRRVTFRCPDIQRFLSLDALHLNLLIQHPDVTEPQWPGVNQNGLIHWDDPDRRPMSRKYTVRSVDAAAKTMDIDFVRHADAGPGSAFAERAMAGDVVGVLGPGGGGLVEADWYLFAGDETALPAIARMSAHLPVGACVKILIEVANRDEIQPIFCSTAADINWLCRNDVEASPGSLLEQAVRGISLTVPGARRYVWIGCEFETFKSLRSYFRLEQNLTKAEHLVVSYWRNGWREDQIND